MILQTVLTLLALVGTTIAVALSIRAINRWRRRVERTDPENAEKAEKDRQRAIFVSKNLKTRVWTRRVAAPAAVPSLLPIAAGGDDDDDASRMIGRTPDLLSIPMGSESPTGLPPSGREIINGIANAALTADESPPSLPCQLESPIRTATGATTAERTESPAAGSSPISSTAAAVSSSPRGTARAGRVFSRLRRRPTTTTNRRGRQVRGSTTTSVDVADAPGESSLVDQSLSDDDSDDDEDNSMNDHRELGHDFMMDGTASSVVTAASSDRETNTENGEDDDDEVTASGQSASLASLSIGMSSHCAICSRSYRDGRDVVCDSNNPSCPHVFHASCMKRWLLLNPNCPLCRHQYLLTFAAKWRIGTTPTTAATPSPDAAAATTANTTTSCSAVPTMVTGILPPATTAEIPHGALADPPSSPPQQQPTRCLVSTSSLDGQAATTASTPKMLDP